MRKFPFMNVLDNAIFIKHFVKIGCQVLFLSFSKNLVLQEFLNTWYTNTM